MRARRACNRGESGAVEKVQFRWDVRVESSSRPLYATVHVNEKSSVYSCIVHEPSGSIGVDSINTQAYILSDYG